MVFRSFSRTDEAEPRHSGQESLLKRLWEAKDLSRHRWRSEYLNQMNKKSFSKLPMTTLHLYSWLCVWFKCWGVSGDALTWVSTLYYVHNAAQCRTAQWNTDETDILCYQVTWWLTAQPASSLTTARPRWARACRSPVPTLVQRMRNIAGTTPSTVEEWEKSRSLCGFLRNGVIYLYISRHFFRFWRVIESGRDACDVFFGTVILQQLYDIGIGVIFLGWRGFCWLVWFLWCVSVGCLFGEGETWFGVWCADGVDFLC